VTVFRHEPLSGEFTLGATGALALPLVGAVAADGLTTRELEIAIENQLREERYLVDPDVSIQVLTRRPFYVLGEVAQPGAYEYVSGMTLVNAVALAGGYTYQADRSSVTIFARPLRAGGNGGQHGLTGRSRPCPGAVLLGRTAGTVAAG
jgi:protein involved in polysaccharide export with SLBB domain